MKNWFLALLCSLSIANAGLVKQTDSNSSQNLKVEKKCFNDKEDLDLGPLLSVKNGDSVAFKVKGKIFTGIVKKIEADPEKLKVIGEFPSENKAGFVFQFGKTKDNQIEINGILFFAGSNKMFTLAYDEAKRVMYFREQNIEVRKEEDK